jgi:AraC-like DNA-binding protein
MRYNPIVISDPLSDVITLIKARSVVTGRLYAGGDWSLLFPVPHDVKFHAVVKGSCWMTWEGDRKPFRVEAGDMVLYTEKRRMILATDLALSPMEVSNLPRDAKDVSLTLGSGDDFLLLGGHIEFDTTGGSLLTDVLPSYIHVKRMDEESAPLQQLATQMVDEVHAVRPGSRLGTTMLAQLMFVHLLRAHSRNASSETSGWLRALADERIGPTLRLIHGKPEHNWGLEELAQAAAMSRSAFALHFKAVVGVSPVAYLIRWRMRLAESALREGNTSVSSLAYSLGYTSESAFSNAFKREMGVAPKHYRIAASGS